MKKQNVINLLAAGALVVALVFGIQSCKKDDPDPCQDTTCLNGGTCNDGTCTCTDGYEGSNCETEEREKFLSGYNCNNSCIPGASWSCNIITSGTGVTKVVLQDIGNVAGLDVTGTVDGTTITIASQTDTDDFGDSWTVEGTGTISGSTLSITLKYTFSGITQTCTENWTKQ